jgi:sulfate/thiosulfate transport system permease protein
MGAARDPMERADGTPLNDRIAHAAGTTAVSGELSPVDAAAQSSFVFTEEAPPASDVGPGAGAPTTWTPARVLLLAGVVLYLGLVLGVPIGALVWEATQQGIRPLVQGVLSPAALQALARSLELTVIAVVANGIFGIAAALVFVRYRFRGWRFLEALVDVTFAVSPVMTGLAFLLLFGRNGWLAPLTSALHLTVAFSFPGLVLATIFVTLPFTVREVSHVLHQIGDEEEQAAATLGASRFQAFRSVTLPNIRHALTVGLTLTAARAMGEFGAVLVLGGAIAGRTVTATTFIYGATEERREPAAFGMAIVLALTSVVLLVVLEHYKNRSRNS